jgi:hypothetical protein
MYETFGSVLWIAAPALFVAAAIFTTMFRSSERGQNRKDALQHEEASNSSQSQRRDNNQNCISRPVDDLQRCFHKCPADNENLTPADRAANSTARATWAIALLTVATILVGISQYLTFDHQLTVMQGQLDASVADQRAWLKISASPISLKFDTNSGAATVQYGLHVTNVGHSVAVGARIEAKAIVIPFHNVFSTLSKSQESFCADSIANKATENMDDQNMGITLFPNENYPQEDIFYGGSTTFTRSEILDSAPIDVNSGQKIDSFVPYLIGCVTYRLSLTNKRHQTGFIYEISRIEPKYGRNLPMMIKIGSDLTPPSLAFISWFFGSGKID